MVKRVFERHFSIDKFSQSFEPGLMNMLLLNHSSKWKLNQHDAGHPNELSRQNTHRQSYSMKKTCLFKRDFWPSVNILF